MNLNEKQIALLDQLYRDASKGLLTAPALNTYLKQQGQKGFTIKNIKEYLDSLETTQTSKLHYSNVSYVAEHPIYSDQGSEFKNATFQKLLDKHNIIIIFALAHAPFIEVFNKTIKYKLIKYMGLHTTTNWSDFLQPVLTAYNNTKHSATGVRVAGYRRWILNC